MMYQVSVDPVGTEDVNRPTYVAITSSELTDYCLTAGRLFNCWQSDLPLTVALCSQE